MKKTELKAIVNGSFNNDLTEVQMLEFDFEDKRSMAWSLIVSMGSVHNFSNVDAKVFKVMPSQYTFDMINHDNVDEILIDVRKKFEERHKQLLRLTGDYYYQLGQEIFRAQKELGFSGCIHMDFRKLIGYVRAMGHWNDFNGAKVSDAIRELEKNVPKFYMPNNPNNGTSQHQWYIQNDYIIMKFEFLYEADKDLYLKFYHEHWQPMAETIKADSVRYELTKHENSESYSLELIYWWD
jgi:hypothetical protein